jgi:hypothetical protein
VIINTNDFIAERHEPPTRESIELSRAKQLAAIQQLRRLILSIETAKPAQPAA